MGGEYMALLGCIFASAYHDPQTRLRAEPARPFAWLNKPYQPRALVTGSALLSRSCTDQSARKRRDVQYPCLLFAQLDGAGYGGGRLSTEGLR
jgi:hypothetical protein